jgi:hypothetical protein
MEQSRMREHEKEQGHSEATSKETLHDVKENEKLSDDKRSNTVKSPDGSFDQDEELKDTDPM